MLIPIDGEQTITPPRDRERLRAVAVQKDLFGWRRVVLVRGAAGDLDAASTWCNRQAELLRDLAAVARRHPGLPLSREAEGLIEGVAA